jgi:thiosulfate dehydrogenase [quinone] large subunit
VPPPKTQKQAQQQRRRYSVIQQARNERRKFIQGMWTGGAAVFGLVAVGYLFNRLFISPTTYISTTGSDTGAANTTTTGTGGSTTASSTATTTSGGSAIAQVSAVPVNSAVNFTIPSNNDPGVLIHLPSGQFVAYDALCTHAGCQVDYDPSSHLLLCPCHGAAFDPAHNAAVVNPPAPTPLPPVAIHVDSASGAITLA